MIRPTLIRHQRAGDQASKWLGDASTTRNKNLMMGIAASVGITALVYYWGFREVEERHKDELREGQRKA